MERNKMSAIAVIAIILGAVGAGVGAFAATVTLTGGADGDNGDDGDDGAIGIKGDKGDDVSYYCASQTEIEAALDTIGTGHGTIIITENITLSSQIDINDGGDYIIQGAGHVTLDRNTDDETFYIENAKTLILKDLIINASDIESNQMPAIYINEGSDNPVYIQNVQIVGPDTGIGIYVGSDNIWIEDCIINGFLYGIYLFASQYSHILDNSLLGMNHSSWNIHGIFLYGSNFNTVSGNVVKDIAAPSTNNASGIYLSSCTHNTLKGNVIYNIATSSGFTCGINIDSWGYNTVTGNAVYDINSIIGRAYGIRLKDTISNSISGNTIRDIIANDEVCGIYKDNSDYNTYTGNTLSDIESINADAYGFRLYISDSNSISGNTLRQIYGSDEVCGIYKDNSNYNTYTGNMLYAIGSINADGYGFRLYISDSNSICSNAIISIFADGDGYGIFGGNDADYNTVLGNALKDCMLGISITGTLNNVSHNTIV